MRFFALAAALLALAAAAPSRSGPRTATLAFTFPDLPYVPGSRIQLDVRGSSSPLELTLVGPGTVTGQTLTLPPALRSGTTTVVAASLHAIALRQVDVVAPPQPRQPLLAVAAYGAGIVLHDAATFRIVGTLGIGGAPSDVAFASDGSLGTSDTTGNTATIARRLPWSISRIDGVPVANEVLFDDADRALLVSNRDIGGQGALTKITANGTTTRVPTGLTAEGLALDRRADIVYVGNVNDGSVLAVDVRTLQSRRRIAAVPRVFGLALSPDGHRLFAVANRSATVFSQAGFVAVIDVGTAQPRILARSAAMKFPLGVAVDAARGRLFVTDESDSVVYVLDSRTLRALRAPIVTCRTPWKPLYDDRTQRLYVPCARADAIDVFDGRTLRRVRGAPFHTGSFPLAIALWQPG